MEYMPKLLLKKASALKVMAFESVFKVRLLQYTSGSKVRAEALLRFTLFGMLVLAPIVTVSVKILSDVKVIF